MLSNFDFKNDSLTYIIVWTCDMSASKTRGLFALNSVSTTNSKCEEYGPYFDTAADFNPFSLCTKVQDI